MGFQAMLQVAGLQRPSGDQGVILVILRFDGLAVDLGGP